MNDHDRGLPARPTAPDPPGDWMEALLRLTGPRPEVPRDVTGRVEAAVRAHWKAECSRRSRTRRLRSAWGLAAAVALGAAAVWLQQGPAPAGRTVGTVELVVASARSDQGAEPPAAEPGRLLRAGDEVVAGSRFTTGEEGGLAMRLASGHSVRMDRDTRLRVLSDRALALDHGGVYVDSGAAPGEDPEPIEIHTSLGRVQDLGTQFEVRVEEDAVRVRVREGAVAFEGEAPPREVRAGAELEVGADGRAISRPALPSGPEWAWVGGVTPTMRIEGCSLREFLDWFARERGLRLRFSGADLEASASRITLNGSIDGMTLDEALASVLSISRTGHRIDGDVLVLEAPSATTVSP